MNLSEKIKQTATFKSLGRVQQKIYGHPRMKKQFEHHLQMILLIGWEKWEEIEHPNGIMRGIIREVNKKAKG